MHESGHGGRSVADVSGLPGLRLVGLGGYIACEVRLDVGGTRELPDPDIWRVRLQVKGACRPGAEVRKAELRQHDEHWHVLITTQLERVRGYHIGRPGHAVRDRIAGIVGL